MRRVAFSITIMCALFGWCGAAQALETGGCTVVVDHAKVAVPDTIEKLVGGKLRFFKSVQVAGKKNEIFLVRGVPTESVDMRTDGPYLKIKLRQAAAKKGKLFDSSTEWNIKSANNGVLIVDDPSIEFIELHKNEFKVSTFVWDFAIALDNTIQVQCLDGSVIERQPLGGLALRK